MTPDEKGGSMPDDDLSAARGIINGLVISVIFWIVAIATFRWLMR